MIDKSKPRELDDIVDEANAFKKLRSDWQRSAYPENGTPVFLVSKEWVDKYKEYIFYKEVQMGRAPEFSADHCIEKFPGQMTNECLLNTNTAKYLVGTGKIKDFAPEVVDTYLKKEVRETVDYEVFSEEMWTQTTSRYGFDREIKRFYTKGQFYYSTSVETRFKDIGCHIVRSDLLQKGEHPGYKFNQHVQLSKRLGYGPLKKRLTDCIQQLYPDLLADETFNSDRIRLWFCEDADGVKKAFDAVATAKTNATAADVEMKTESNGESGAEETEENTGVESPGTSLEPLVGTMITIEDKDFGSNLLIVEVGTPGFAFKFKK